METTVRPWWGTACALALVTSVLGPGSATATPVDLRIHWIEPAWVSNTAGGTVEVSGLGFDSTITAAIDGVQLPAASVQVLSPTRLRLILPAAPAPKISTLRLTRTLDPVNIQTASKTGGIFYTGPIPDLPRAEIFYVRPAPGGSDSNPGTSPTAPKATLNAAIDAAMGTNDSLPLAPAQIRAAAGTYSENVRVPRGAVLLGGWSTDFTQRDPDRFVSIIDGRRNNLSAVRTSGSTENFCLLDGFTLTNSRRTGAGAAFRSFLGGPTLSNNVIIGNIASKRGAGIYFRFGEPFDASGTIAKNLIVGNRAQELSGGGVLLYAYYYTNQGDINVAVTDNLIVGNRAVLHGGGMAVGNSVYYTQDRLNVSVSHNRIQFNLSESGGALAVYPALSTQFSVRAHNNLMQQNSAADRGGAVFFGGAGGGDLQVTSSTLVSNSAAAGGALYRAVPLRTGSQFTSLTDDILWSNTGGDVGDPEGSVVIHYTLSNDDFSLRGAGNFSSDPRFVAGPLGPFYLDPTSPAIDNGSDLASVRGLSERTTLVSQSLDAGRLDIGVHYPATSVTGATTPQFLHLVPAFGNFLGGDWVLARGSDFRPGARVTFGGTDAVRTLFVAGNRLLAEPPPRALQGASTLVNVQVINPGSAASTQTLQYRYLDADIPEWDSTLGVISADSPEESGPAVIVRWNPALDAVSPPVKYNVHRELNSGTASQLIIPQASNLIASGLSGTSYVDRAFSNPDVGDSFVYRVRALDSAFLPNEEMNLTRVFGTVLTGSNAARPDPSVYLLGPREATSGDVVTLEVLVSNQGTATAASLGLDVSLPSDMLYVAGSTRRDTTIVIADDTSGTPFPLDLPGITLSNVPHSTSTRISFQVRLSGAGGLLSWVGVVSSKSGPEVRADNNRFERFINTKPLPGTDLSVLKTGPAAALSGTNITYAIRVTNNGTLTAQNVILTDTLPASGLSYVNGSTRRDGAVVADNPSGTPFPLDGSGLALGSFGGADFTVVEFTATFTATSGSVVNTAAATTSTTDINTSNNTSQTATGVLTADLALSKTAFSGVVSGRDLVYMLDVSVVSASDPSGARGASLLDTLPAGVTYRAGTTLRDGSAVPDNSTGTPLPLDGAGLSLGDIAVGITTRVQFTVRVDLASGSLVNQANVSALSTDPSGANNASQTTTTVVPAGTPLGPVGNTLRWDAASGALDWDAAPGAAIYFVHRAGSGSAFASGSTTSMTPLGITASAYTDPLVPAPGQALFYRVTAGDGMTQTDELHMADLQVEKSGPASVVDGTLVTYTVLVRNASARQAEGVRLVDTLPSQASYIAGSTRQDGTAVPDDAAGSPFPLDGTGLALTARPAVSLTALTFDARLVGRNVTATNRATVSTTTPQHTAANDTDDAATALVPPPQADLNLSLTDAPDPVMGSGGTLRYTLVLRNDGTLAADSVVLSSTLPAGVTFLSSTPAPTSTSGATRQFALGTLAASDGAAGGSDERTVTIDVRVDIASGTLSHQASATTTTFEEDLTDNSASASTTVQRPPADLGIDKTGPATTAKRAFVIYTLTVSNAGPGLGDSVVVTDTLPTNVTYTTGSTRLNGAVVPDSTSGTAFPIDGSGLNIGNLAFGASATITFEVRMPNTATTVINQATVTSAAPDPNTANNSDSVSTSVQ